MIAHFWWSTDMTAYHTYNWSLSTDLANCWLLNENGNLLKYLQRVVLQSAVRVTTKAHYDDQNDAYKAKDGERGDEYDLSELVHERGNRGSAGQIWSSPIDIRKYEVRWIRKEIAPTRTVEKQLYYLYLAGLLVSGVWPRRTVFSIYREWVISETKV